MSTRPITSADAHAAAEIIRLIRARPNDLIDPFPPAVEMEVLADSGARGRGADTHPRVAEHEGTVVGYGAVDFSPDLRAARLVGPVVHPAHRNKGYGRRLLHDLLDQARTAHQKQLTASVGSQNLAGGALLKAEGFRKRATHTCLRMTRPPRPAELSMNDIIVRRVAYDDADVVSEYIKPLVPRTAKQTRSLLKSDEYAIILAFRNGSPTGLVEVDMRYGEIASVEHLEGPDTLIQKGLGNLLLAEAVRVAFQDESIDRLDLLVAGTNKKLIASYVEAGFQRRHELVTYELKL